MVGRALSQCQKHERKHELLRVEPALCGSIEVAMADSLMSREEQTLRNLLQCGLTVTLQLQLGFAKLCGFPVSGFRGFGWRGSGFRV